MPLQSLYFKKNIAAEESNLDDFIWWVWAEKVIIQTWHLQVWQTETSKMLEMKETLKRKEQIETSNQFQLVPDLIINQNTVNISKLQK